MHTIEAAAERIDLIAKMIPAGVEHYIFRSKSAPYINVRTTDPVLLDRLRDAASAA
jgi:hypothetical protein